MSTMAAGLLAQATDHPRLVGERIAAWCRTYDYKSLARMFGVEPRTAKAWRTGSLPQMKHLIAMAQFWGEGFLQDIFQDVLVETDAALDRRLERLERELHSIRRDLHADAAEAGSAAADDSRGMVHASCSALARTVKAISVALAFVAVGVSLTAGDEMRHARAGRYGGRPPMVRVSRGGREA